MFAHRLKQLRTEKGLTQRTLAETLNLSHGTIGMYESGAREPDHDTLRRLADFFRVSIDYLLGRVDDPTGRDSIELARDTVARWRVTVEDLELRKLDLLRAMKEATSEHKATVRSAMKQIDHDLANARGELEAAEHDLKLAQDEYDRLHTVLRTPADDLFYFLRGHQLTDEDVEAVKDLLEARRLRRQREERQQSQP